MAEKRNEDRRRTDRTVEQVENLERPISDRDPAAEPTQEPAEVVNDALIEDRFEASDN